MSLEEALKSPLVKLSVATSNACPYCNDAKGFAGVLSNENAVAGYGM